MVDFSNLFNKLHINSGASAKSALNGASATPADNADDDPGTIPAITSSDNGTKKWSITLGGDTHSIVFGEAGEVWDYNTTDEVWTTRENNGDVLSFKALEQATVVGNTVNLTNIKASTATLKHGSTISKYNLASDSTIKTSTIYTGTKLDKDNNPNAYNIAIIDNFSDTTSEGSVEIDGSDVTHGDVVRALISGAGSVDTATDTSNSLNYDLGSDFSFTNILSKLQKIDNDIAHGADIDAVNLSLGITENFKDLGLSTTETDLKTLLASLGTDAGKTAVINKLTASGETDLVNILNKITSMASEGVEFFIASGNDFDDIQAANGDEYYDDYSSYDTNNDGYVTGKELGVFNALTLASGSNVHVIGATSSVEGNSVADYADINGTVDAYYNGDVNVMYLGQDDSGKYKYDVNDDGIADIFASSSDGNSYLVDGTSFATPRAAKIDDKKLVQLKGNSKQGID